MNNATYSSLLELAAGLVILCAFVTLWRRSLSAIVRALCVQGVALGVVALVLGVHRHAVVLITVGALVIAAKGAVIPTLLKRVLANDSLNRETSPLVNVPVASMGSPYSALRHMPMALKFSKARPNGSMRLWQELHKASCRCLASVARYDGG